MRDTRGEYGATRRHQANAGPAKAARGQIAVLAGTALSERVPNGFDDILSGLDEIRLRLERLEEKPRYGEAENDQVPDDMRFYRWLRRSYRERLLRREAFEQDFIVSDPSWDMLLDLCISKIEGRKISVTSLCLASGAPTSTAVRWIGLLEHQGMIERHPDPDDKRRVFVRISRPAFDTMFRYFKRIGGQ